MKRIRSRIWVSATFWSGVFMLAMVVLVAVVSAIETLGLFLSLEQVLRTPGKYILVFIFSLFQAGAMTVAGVCTILYSREYKRKHFPKEAKPSQETALPRPDTIVPAE